MSVVKVSVEDLDTNNKILLDLDNGRSLEENIKIISNTFDKPPEAKSGLYGLKLLSTNDGRFRNVYITEENYDEIKDGYFLKLAYSLDHLIDRIFDHLNDEFKERSFEDLYSLSTDEEFIKQLARSSKHLDLIEFFVGSDKLENSEMTPCLIVIVHLFRKGLIKDISDEFVDKVFEVLDEETYNEEAIKYALSILHKILCQKDHRFDEFKQKIIIRLPFKILFGYVERFESRDLRFGTLLLINTIVRCCKEPQKTQLVKELGTRQMREKVYKHIIVRGQVHKDIAHELYVYQTHALSWFSETLNERVSINETLKREFGLARCDLERRSLIMDFDEEAIKYKNMSVEDLFRIDDNTRFSIASMVSTKSEATSGSQRASHILREDMLGDELTISSLTQEALRYFKDSHYDNFCQSQIEEQIYEPGIFITSERVMKILSKLLHIGKDPEKSCQIYQPIIFNCVSIQYFLFELFCRTLWLLSKTRRDMKTSTYSDYPKVMKVLRKQLEMILEKKPINFKVLAKEMSTMTYAVVAKQFQAESEGKMRDVLDNNPCVQQLRMEYSHENDRTVFEQRMNVLHRGEAFIKIVDNKKVNNARIWLRVCENNRQFTVGDWDAKNRLYFKAPKSYPISNITHVVEGKACPHVKSNEKDYEQSFSIVLNHSDYINFTADKKETAYYWTDGFYMLTGKPNRSKLYHDELRQLIEMDLTLHLLELQDVTIPKAPPPVPVSPYDSRNKPAIPPRPLQLMARLAQINSSSVC